ncbi:unnamed protein product [Prorocentrum cordatum]|uniref:Uncharacterized protein n=1 Tax=Prorocentrum cordatum TaxID=2364126 RepID=A0ABN9VR24_9DINO|nr:unnamed protein product [Polarella glacialis]
MGVGPERATITRIWCSTSSGGIPTWATPTSTLRAPPRWGRNSMRSSWPTRRRPSWMSKEGGPRKRAEADDLKKAMAPRVGFGEQKSSIDELEARAECVNCGQRGRWQRERANLFRPRPKGQARDSAETL